MVSSVVHLVFMRHLFLLCLLVAVVLGETSRGASTVTIPDAATGRTVIDAAFCRSAGVLSEIVIDGSAMVGARRTVEVRDCTFDIVRVVGTFLASGSSVTIHNCDFGHFTFVETRLLATDCSFVVQNNRFRTLATSENQTFVHMIYLHAISFAQPRTQLKIINNYFLRNETYPTSKNTLIIALISPLFNSTDCTLVIDSNVFDIIKRDPRTTFGVFIDAVYVVGLTLFSASNNVVNYRHVNAYVTGLVAVSLATDTFMNIREVLLDGNQVIMHEAGTNAPLSGPYFVLAVRWFPLRASANNFFLRIGHMRLLSMCRNSVLVRGYHIKLAEAVRMEIEFKDKKRMDNGDVVDLNIDIDRYYIGYIDEVRLNDNRVAAAVDPKTGNFYGLTVDRGSTVALFFIVAVIEIKSLQALRNELHSGLYGSDLIVFEYNNNHPVTIIHNIEIAYNVLHMSTPTVEQLKAAGVYVPLADIFGKNKPFNDVSCIELYLDVEFRTATQHPSVTPSNFANYTAAVILIHSNVLDAPTAAYIRFVLVLIANACITIKRLELFNNTAWFVLRTVPALWASPTMTHIPDVQAVSATLGPLLPIYNVIFRDNSLRIDYQFYEQQGFFNAKLLVAVQLVSYHPQFMHNCTVRRNRVEIISFMPIVHIQGTVAGADILRTDKLDNMNVLGVVPGVFIIEENLFSLNNIAACPPTGCSCVSMRHVGGVAVDWPEIIIRNNVLRADNIGGSENFNPIAIFSFFSVNPDGVERPSLGPSGIATFTTQKCFTYHYGPVTIEGNSVVFTRIRPNEAVAPFFFGASTMSGFRPRLSSTSNSRELNYTPLTIRNNNITFQIEPSAQQQLATSKFEAAPGALLLVQIAVTVGLSINSPEGTPSEFNAVNITVSPSLQWPNLFDFAHGQIVIENCVARLVGITSLLCASLSAEVYNLGGIIVRNSTLHFIGSSAARANTAFNFFRVARPSDRLFFFTQNQPRGVFRGWRSFSLNITKNSVIIHSRDPAAAGPAEASSSSSSASSSFITLWRDAFYDSEEQPPLVMMAFNISGDSRIQSASSTSLVEWKATLYPDLDESRMYGPNYRMPKLPPFPLEFGGATRFVVAVESGSRVALSGNQRAASASASAERAVIARGLPIFEASVFLRNCSVEFAASSSDEAVLVSLLKPVAAAADGEGGAAPAPAEPSDSALPAAVVIDRLRVTSFVSTTTTAAVTAAREYNNFDRLLRVPAGSQPVRRGDKLPVLLQARCVFWNGVRKSKLSSWSVSSAAAAIDLKFSKCPNPNGKVSSTISREPTESVVPECAPFSLVYLGEKMALRSLLYWRSFSFTVALTPRIAHKSTNYVTSAPLGAEQSLQWTQFRNNLRWPPSDSASQQQLGLSGPILTVVATSPGGTFDVNATYVSNGRALRVQASLLDVSPALEGPLASYSVTLRLNREALACTTPAATTAAVAGGGRDSSSVTGNDASRTNNDNNNNDNTNKEDLVINFARNAPEEISTQLLAFSETSSRVAMVLTAGMSAGSVAKNAARSLMLGRYVDCMMDIEESPLPFELSPLGLAVGHEKARYFRGAVFGNGLLLLLFVSILCIAVVFWLVGRDSKRKKALMERRLREKRQGAPGDSGDEAEHDSSPLLHLRQRNSIGVRPMSGVRRTEALESDFAFRAGASTSSQRVAFDASTSSFRRASSVGNGDEDDDDDVVDFRAAERQHSRSFRPFRRHTSSSASRALALQKRQQEEKKQLKSLLTWRQFKRSLFSVGFVEIIFSLNGILMSGTVSSAASLALYGPPQTRFIDICTSIGALSITLAFGLWGLWVTAYELPRRPRVMFLYNPRKTGKNAGNVQQKHLAEDSDSPDETEIVKYLLHVPSSACADCCAERDKKRASKKMLLRQLQGRKSSMVPALAASPSFSSDDHQQITPTRRAGSNSGTLVARPVLKRLTAWQRILPYLEDFFMHSGNWKVASKTHVQQRTANNKKKAKLAEVADNKNKNKNNNSETKDDGESPATKTAKESAPPPPPEEKAFGSDSRFIARCGEAFRDCGGHAPSYLSGEYLLLFCMSVVDGYLPAAKSPACFAMGTFLSILNVIPFVVILAKYPYRHWLANCYAVLANLSITIQCISLLTTYMVGDIDWLMITSAAMKIALDLAGATKMLLDILMVYFESPLIVSYVVRRLRHHLLHGEYSPFNQRARARRKRKEEEEERELNRVARTGNREPLVRLLDTGEEGDDTESAAQSPARSNSNNRNTGSDYSPSPAASAAAVSEKLSAVAAREGPPGANIKSRRARPQCWDI